MTQLRYKQYTRDALLRELERHADWDTTGGYALAIQHSRTTTRRYLDQLVREGRVEVWKITHCGRAPGPGSSMHLYRIKI
jgi:response regulator of citrate/malate metabolism